MSVGSLEACLTRRFSPIPRHQTSLHLVSSRIMGMALSCKLTYHHRGNPINSLDVASLLSSAANPDINKAVSSNTNAMFNNAGTQTGPIPDESGKAGESLSIALVEELHSYKNIALP